MTCPDATVQHPFDSMQRPRSGPVARDAAARPVRRSPTSPLNVKDRELLGHLADGRSTGQVAAAMAVSRNTARTRIRRLRGKLAAPDRGRIVGTARGLGLV